MHMVTKETITDQELTQIVQVWESSVRATHTFLTEDNILSLRPLVQSGVSQIEHLICVEQEQKILAFMGIHGDKIEMLFVNPDQRGRGIGKKLIDYAREKMNVRYVDVNEQNEQAVGFYQHLGFEVFERSAYDDQGNPFPILRMRLYNHS